MNKEKLAVTVWSYKGGVGKSTISLILCQIAAQEGLKVLAVDLDEQRNLIETLKLSSSLFPVIDVRNELKEGYAKEDYDFYVVDTHPTKDKTVQEALKFADIVLVPVLGDYQSLVNLSVVFDYVYQAGVGKEQVVIVKNCMGNLRITEEVEAVLDEQGYSVAGRLPRCNMLLRNIASGNEWDKYLREDQRGHFIRLYKNVWRAYREMLNGNFVRLWDTKSAK